MLDTVSEPLHDSIDAPDWIPHTLREAHHAWEETRQRNIEIRRRFEEGQTKGVLLRSAAMLPSWQT